MGNRNIHIKAKRRKHPDYRKLSRALIELAAAQAEADAAATDSRQPASDPDNTKEQPEKQLGRQPHGD